MVRASGVLLPIFSLPSKYGIGALGEAAYKFIDILKKSKQSYWQVLPVNTTSFGNSPYSSISCFSGNPLFIDLDELALDGLIDKSEYENISFGDDENKIDYDKLSLLKMPLLKSAALRLIKKFKNEFNEFVDKYSFYLNDYALFCVLKDKYHGKSFVEWDDEYKYKNKNAIDDFYKSNKKEIECYQALQYIFYKQWFKLKKYANDNGIKIIGDMPIYSAYDSCDVWSNSSIYQLNDDLTRIEVSGCPPDGFSEDGQLWGNPLYNYEYIENNGFKYFIEKFRFLFSIYDIIRIDHFRGFESYYAIDSKMTNAKVGQWKIGPGAKLFDALKKNLPNAEFIAEDLGFLTESVHKLLAYTNFPGMKVMEFGFNHFDKENTMYLPHTYIENSVAYLGTHDNNTFIGWLNEISKEDFEYVKEYLLLKNPASYHLDALYALYNSKSYLAIVMPQDILAKDSSARINTPGIVSDNNWSYRFVDSDFDDNFVYLLKTLTVSTNRSSI